MADEIPATVPTETPPPPSPADAVDESGVPWKNRLAELGRKLDVERRELEAQRQLNLQYQQVLGQRQGQPPAPVPTEKKNWSEVFDPDALAAVKELATEQARQVAFSMLARARVNQEIGEDPKVRELAQQQYAALVADPYYGQHSVEILEELAVARARNLLTDQQRKATTAQNQQTAVQQANQSLLGATSLPSTTRTDGSTPSQTQEEFVKKWIADPNNRDDCQRLWRVSPDSPEGQKHLRGAAEWAFKNNAVPGNLTKAIKMVAEFQAKGVGQ
jgi:hypothetical protein